MNQLRVALVERAADTRRDNGVLGLPPPEIAGTSSQRLAEGGRA